MLYQQRFVIYCVFHPIQAYFHRRIIAQAPSILLIIQINGTKVGTICRVYNIDIITERRLRQREYGSNPDLHIIKVFRATWHQIKVIWKAFPDCARVGTLWNYITNDVARDLSSDDGILRLKFSFGWIQPQKAFCSCCSGGIAAELRPFPHVIAKGERISLFRETQYLRADPREIIGMR